MQKVLITGTNGFIGHYLSRLLLQKGYCVMATGKGESRLPFTEQNFIYRTLDFTDNSAVQAFFAEHRPDVVVHCGAMSKPDECELHKENAFHTNVTGTLYLLQAAAALKSFFVFLSTDFVFDGERGMYREDDLRKPVNYYGETKLLAEDKVMKYESDWAIVRTVLVYGKPFFSRQNILTNVAASLKKGAKMQVFNDQVRTPTYVEDLVSGIARILEKRAAGIYHISGEDVLTPYQMALAVARYLNLDASLIQSVEEKDFDQPARRPLKTGLDLSKAKAHLHYQPVSFQEGLKKTFA